MHFLKWLLGGLVLIGIIWYLLTLYVQQPGGIYLKDITSQEAKKKAVLVFDPDPFYNLDEKLCNSFARALKERGFNAYIRSPQSLESSLLEDTDLLVLCSNTYNWAPDTEIRSFWKNYRLAEGQKTALMTLGGGATARARRIMEEAILNKNGFLVGSREFWTWKPNDEKRTDEKNSVVAQDMVYQWAIELSSQL
jgi:hypothetical protein